MMDGWIKLYRQILKWEWYSDVNVCRLFIHLLLTANHKANKWRGIAIEKGQKLTSLKHLAEETGLSVQQVRTSILKLKSTNEITHRTTRQYSIISIVKWDDYQSEQHTRKQTGNKRVTTNKNDKNDKKNYQPKELLEKDSNAELDEILKREGVK